MPVGAGVYELRVHHGPGYRVYFAKEGEYLFLLLCGGDKGTQDADIARAQSHWAEHQARARKELVKNAKKKKR
jgi:putative addiction module killer protein